MRLTKAHEKEKRALLGVCRVIQRPRDNALAIAIRLLGAIGFVPPQASVTLRRSVSHNWKFEREMWPTEE